MASTEGLMPITRAYLASYYDKYPFPPLSDDVARLSSEIRSLAARISDDFPLSQGESSLVDEADSQPPIKIDENMWKNREQIEEIIYLLDRSHWPNALLQQASEDAGLSSTLGKLKDYFEGTLKILQFFQNKNSEFVFNTVMTYMPQDFRGTIIRQQRERSERNKQAEVDALVSSGCSIRDRYAVLWKQQMDRRRQLAQLGSATGVYKTLVKYLVGVPQVLLDFIRQINDEHGPMEEQRQRYGPPLYSLTAMVFKIRLFLSLAFARLEVRKLQKHEISVLEEAVLTYTSEFERTVKFMGDVFANSPFFITAEVAGAMDGSKTDDYREISIPAGKTHEVSFSVDSINSYIAWDFSLVQGKVSMDIGFSLEYIDSSGNKSIRFECIFFIEKHFVLKNASMKLILSLLLALMILPYRRFESDQGNFCTCMAGNYRLVWDNSYSTFFRKVLRCKVDCIPPVAESVPSATEEG